jgi:TolA-binding protein
VFPRLILAGALLTVATAAVTQESADEQARRLLEDGRAYRAQGKLKQALDNFNTIVSGFANTDSVGLALLEIGRYRQEVDGDFDKARASYEEVAKRYPQSDAAPGAYYLLGLLTLSRAATPAELDDALAQFTRVQRLYAKSDWVPRAIYASGLVHRKAGRLPEAVEAQRKVSLEYPTSEAAPAAQFQIGHCLALVGQPREAMEEFQQVRNRFPDSEWAAPALERTTALYRLHGAPKPVFVLDPGYGAGTGDLLRDVRALLMAPGDVLWIASDKTKSAVPIDPGGKMGAGFSADDFRNLSLSPKGEVLVTSKVAVRIGPKEVKAFAIPGEKLIPEPLDRILSATMTAGGSYLVADEKRKKVYRFDSTFEFKGTFPEARDAKEREVTRMFVDGEGGIVLLDRQEKTVRVYDEAGKPVRSLGPAGLRKPVDVAVDSFLNAYVADEEGGISVYSPKGQLVANLGGEEIKRPRALTLDSAGAVFVYDEKAQKVLRYR